MISKIEHSNDVGFNESLEHVMLDSNKDKMFSEGESETGHNEDFIEDESNGIGEDVVLDENDLNERQTNANTDSEDSKFVLTEIEQLKENVGPDIFLYLPDEHFLTEI